jgi:MFS family permease
MEPGANGNPGSKGRHSETRGMPELFGASGKISRRRIIPAAPEGLQLSTASSALAVNLLAEGTVAGSILQTPAVQPAADAAPARASARGLDWFTFFLADIQTGFGPFVAVYLTANSWTQVDIGLVLTAGGLVALVGQMPGGALVDAVRSARWVAGLAVAAICMSAFVTALWPVFLIVIGARALQAAASCVLGPAIAAISLGLAGHAGLGERIGRNARFASIGSGVAAAAMGACGYLLSNQAVFLLTAVLVVPALVALAQIRTSDLALTSGRDRIAAPDADAPKADLRSLLCNRRLMTFAACVILFQLANAAMLPLMGSMMTMRASEWAATLIAACIVVPQLVVAACSPWVGRQAQIVGRRPLLLLCFAAVAVRGALFALISSPHLVLVVQILDGVSAAIFGIMFALVVADITRDSGRFNLALGIVGSAVGIGASMSTTLAGYMFDHFGAGFTFASMSAVAFAGMVLIWLAMPETRPDPEAPAPDAVGDRSGSSPLAGAAAQGCGA